MTAVTTLAAAAEYGEAAFSINLVENDEGWTVRVMVGDHVTRFTMTHRPKALARQRALRLAVVMLELLEGHAAVDVVGALANSLSLSDDITVSTSGGLIS